MILDHNPIRDTFTLRVDRGDTPDPVELRERYGFDMSLTASTAGHAVMFTREPYAAASFIKFATARARGKLGGIADAIERSRADADGGHYRVPADRELWPFQKASVRYALDTLGKGAGCLIADQPGLGKTPIGITIANELDAQRILVICPANIRLQWAERIYEWTTMQWPFTLHSVLLGRHGINPHAAWTVISYDLARAPPIHTSLMQARFDLIILDEAHALKSTGAKRTRAILGPAGLASRATHKIALTGTPLPNRPREAYTLARELDWEAIDWATEHAFGERYNPRQVHEWTDRQGRTQRRTEERQGREPELQNRLRANFMVRHEKRDVMTQLQLPSFDLVYVDETRAVKAALHAESLLDIDPDHLLMSSATGEFEGGHIAVARRIMGEAIAPLAAQYVQMLLDGGEDKVVVFGWHISVLDTLEQSLRRFRPLRIDGSTSAVRKQAAIKAFIADPGHRVIVGNLQSMGVGTDGLQHVASHAVIVEPSWTPSDNEQAFDRLDRGGQRNAVQGDIMVAKGSIAEKILGAALQKGRTIHNVLDRQIGD